MQFALHCKCCRRGIMLWGRQKDTLNIFVGWFLHDKNTFLFLFNSFGGGVFACTAAAQAATLARSLKEGENDGLVRTSFLTDFTNTSRFTDWIIRNAVKISAIHFQWRHLWLQPPHFVLWDSILDTLQSAVGNSSSLKSTCCCCCRCQSRPLVG